MTHEQELKLKEIGDSIGRIEAVLIGDRKYETKGLIHKVGEHEAKIKQFDDLKVKGTGILAALGFVGGIVSTGIIATIKYFTSSHT